MSPESWGSIQGRSITGGLQFNKLSKNQFTVADGTNYSKNEIAEIRRLKKQVADLKAERDFLKKRRRTLQKPTN